MEPTSPARAPTNRRYKAQAAQTSPVKREVTVNVADKVVQILAYAHRH